jgi:hypothetical protein
MDSESFSDPELDELIKRFKKLESPRRLTAQKRMFDVPSPVHPSAPHKNLFDEASLDLSQMLKDIVEPGSGIQTDRSLTPFKPPEPSKGTFY